MKTLNPAVARVLKRLAYPAKSYRYDDFLDNREDFRDLQARRSKSALPDFSAIAPGPVFSTRLIGLTSPGDRS
jgi:hypothetical protein